MHVLFKSKSESVRVVLIIAVLAGGSHRAPRGHPRGSHRAPWGLCSFSVEERQIGACSWLLFLGVSMFSLNKKTYEIPRKVPCRLRPAFDGPGARTRISGPTFSPSTVLVLSPLTGWLLLLHFCNRVSLDRAATCFRTTWLSQIFDLSAI